MDKIKNVAQIRTDGVKIKGLSEDWAQWYGWSFHDGKNPEKMRTIADLSPKDVKATLEFYYKELQNYMWCDTCFADLKVISEMTEEEFERLKTLWALKVKS